MVILMGIRDEELIQRLISLDGSAPLQDVVNLCRPYEATQTTASAIHASPWQMCAVSSYKQQKRWKRAQTTATPGLKGNPASQQSSGQPCVSCGCKHSPSKCPASEATCSNCGYKGYWAKKQKCPTKSVQCRYCRKMGHYDKCCRSKMNAATALPPFTPATRTVKACLSTSDVTLTDASSPRPVCIQLSMDMSSQIHMLPDTGADVTVIGKPCHLERAEEQSPDCARHCYPHS